MLVHAALEHVPGRYRGGEGDDPPRFWQLNVDGSVALLAAAREAGVARAWCFRAAPSSAATPRAARRRCRAFARHPLRRRQTAPRGQRDPGAPDRRRHGGLGLDPAPPHGQGPAREVDRRRRRARAHRRAPRRRRLRRQGRHRHRPRRHRDRRAQARAPGEVGRDPQRGDAVDAGPRPGAVRRARAEARRHHHRAADAGARRVRRVRRLRRRARRGPDVHDGAGALRRARGSASRPSR